MKNLAVVVGLAACLFANISQGETQREAYQAGLKIAQQAKHNQEQWDKGQGSSKMASSYQKGKNLASQMKAEQRSWVVRK